MKYGIGFRQWVITSASGTIYEEYGLSKTEKKIKIKRKHKLLLHCHDSVK